MNGKRSSSLILYIQVASWGHVYDCEEERKYSQLQYGDMPETETVGEKVLSGL